MDWENYLGVRVYFICLLLFYIDATADHTSVMCLLLMS